jgi:hypothetical protein
VKKRVLIKVIVGLVILVLFGILFMQSLEDERRTAYTVPRQHLQKWTVALETPSNANDPLMVLQPVPELTSGLFRQVFARAMESLNTPASAGIPVITRGEFDRVVGDQLSKDALVSAARGAGLETASITPRCVVHRRVSEPGGTRQVYFVLFDAPAIAQFRQKVGLDPAVLSPILFVAGAGSDFNTWLPLRVDVDADCLAPVDVTE